MSNLALAFVNLADLGTWTASAALTLAPASRLQNKHVLRKTRANAAAVAYTCDLGSSRSIDTVALMGLSGANPTLRVRVSTVDSSGVAGDAYDSGDLTGAWDPNYLPFVRLIAAPVIGRYGRIDVSELGVSYIEAGRAFVGLRQQFGMNFAPGWQRAWVDPTKRTIGRGGQSFDDQRDKHRSLQLTLESMSEDDRWDIAEELDIVLGQSGDMLVITDPDSSNLSRDCLWGYNETLDPVTEPVVVAGGPRYARTFRIRERL